uniref:Glycerate kinase n=1 Tax=Anopheles maculatus TaxID=74869 RepID=A0A182SMT7_9DIPT
MSTCNHTNATKLKQLFLCGVDAVKPKSLFEGCNNTASKIHQSFNHDRKRYHVIGFGKAVLGMAVQAEKLLGSRLHSGSISIPLGTSEKFAGDVDFSLSANTTIEVIECARNNLPDERSLMAAGKIKQIANSMTSEDVLCVLVSGGGSALLCVPKAPITLSDKLQIIKSLSTAGASIDELNYVRIALSDVKGGQLAMEAKNAFRVYSYVISDIVDDPVALIASGPTVVQKGVDVNGIAKEILRKYRLWDELPNAAKEIIAKAWEKEDKINLGNNELFLLGTNAVALEQVNQPFAYPVVEKEVEIRNSLFVFHTEFGRQELWPILYVFYRPVQTESMVRRMWPGQLEVRLLQESTKNVVQGKDNRY